MYPVLETLRSFVNKELSKHNESWDGVIAYYIELKADLADDFDVWDDDKVKEAHDENGNVKGKKLTSQEQEEAIDARWLHSWCPYYFTIWTTSRVYFPAVYENSEWCASVPRFSLNEATKHIGRRF